MNTTTETSLVRAERKRPVKDHRPAEDHTLAREGRLTLSQDDYKGRNEDFLVGGITGLIDKDQYLKLKYDLFLAAHSPANDPERKPELVDTDPSTWTWENLSTMDGPSPDIVRLANLQRYAGKSYVRKIRQAFNMLKMTEVKCSNIAPIKTYLNAEDKHNLTHSAGDRVVFNLDVKVFDRGNAKNSVEVFRKLKELICPEATHYATLLASPIHTVTLPEAARARAGIPESARFYCFCYPPAGTAGTAGMKDSELAAHDAPLPSFPIKTFADESKRAQSMMKSLEALKLDMSDPFVALIMYGGFLYFDHTYEIVAVNSLSVDEVPESTSALYLGAESDLPPMAIGPLEELQRWLPVTSDRLRKYGYTHFAWICPSEFVGDSIFTISGGFAYLHKDPNKSKFFPVAPKILGDKDNDLYKKNEPEKLMFQNDTCPTPQPYNAPLHIPELLAHLDKEVGDTGAHNKFAGSVDAVSFSEGKGSALGIFYALFDDSDKAEFDEQCNAANGRTPDDDLKQMEAEIEALKDHPLKIYRDAYGLCREWFDYVVNKAAVEEEVTGNDGHTAKKDKGHYGMTLNDFWKLKQATDAKLTRAEVAALRFYTSKGVIL